MLIEKELVKYEPNEISVRYLKIMASICGIIGTDFSEKKLYKPITTYLENLQNNDYGGHLSLIMHYLSFVYLQRDYSLSGDHLNTYILSFPTDVLPKPQRHVPYYFHSVYEDEITPDEKYNENFDEFSKFDSWKKSVF